MPINIGADVAESAFDNSYLRTGGGDADEESL